MRVELMNCEEQLLAEIADPKMRRKDVALTYAYGLRQGQVEVGKVNRAILRRWGTTGLSWIKREAWAWMEGKRG